MRTFLLALLFPCAVLAQEGPPPETVAPTTGTATATGTTLVDDRTSDEAPPEGEAPLPEKILEPPPPEAAPTVSIRTDGRSGDVVEEYRQNGRLTMVKVRPLKGPPYTLMDTNGDGRLDAKDGEGPVRPVYWTIYEWN